MGPEDFIHTVYNNASHAAQRAFVTHLSWMREEGKTSIYQHKSAVYNGSHIPGAQAAFSHNDTTGGTEPYWLNTFGYSQLHGNSEFLDVMWCNIKA